MPKMNLPEAYADGTKSYGPGDGVEVPPEAAKKIRAYQKEFESTEGTDAESEAQES